MNRHALLACVWGIALIVTIAPTAHAQSTWTGGGGNGNWSTALNWDTPPANDPSTAIILAGTTNLTTILDTAPNAFFDINSLTVASGAGAFIINPTATNVTTLRIGGGGITLNSTNDFTIAAPIALSAAQTWSRPSGTNLFTVSGPVNLGGFGLTIAGTGATTISGVVSGSAGITKSGAGTLTMSAANTFSGGVIINAGVLTTNSLANGGTASGIGQSSNAAANLQLNGGTLQYTGAAASTDRLFTLTQAGGTINASGTGAVNFTNTGSVAFTGAGTRTLTFTGSTGPVNTVMAPYTAPNGTVYNYTIPLSTAFNTFAAKITDSGSDATSVVKSGTGTWVLSGANTYTGGTTTTANGGILAVNRITAGVTPVGTGGVTLGGGTLSFRATSNPLTVTGFNQDSISSARDVVTPNPFGTTTSIDNAPGVAGGFTLIETRPDFNLAYNDTTLGGTGVAVTAGLPVGGRFVHGSNQATTFQMAAYDNGTGGGINNNDLYLSNASTLTGNLLLAAGSQSKYQTINILTTSGNGATTYNAKLNFSDGTSTTVNGLTSPDWFNGALSAVQMGSRMSRDQGRPTNDGTNPRLYSQEIFLSTADQAKTLTSIDFTYANAVGSNTSLNVFGVSGAAAVTGDTTNYGNAVTLSASSTLQMLNTSSLAFGTLTVGAAATLTTDTGTLSATSLTFNGVNVSGGSPTFNLATNQTLNLGAITFAGATARTVTFGGNGTTTLGAATAGSYSAINRLTVNGGTVTVASITALGDTPNLTVGGGTANINSYSTLNTLTVSGGTANLTTVNNIAATATITGGTTTFTPAVAIPTATINGGTTTFSAGGTLTTATVNGGTVNVNGATAINTLLGTGGTLNLGGATLTIGGGNSSGNYTGSIVGTGAVTKVGTGTQVFGGRGNSFNGLNVTGGTVTAVRPGALGGGAVSLSDGTTLAVGGINGPSINGFGGNGTGFNLQGANNSLPTITNDVLTITTNNGNLARSVWYNTPYTVANIGAGDGSFRASFRYQDITGGGADGITFTVQGQSSTALGGGGGSLGYANPGITPSLALQVNIFGTAGINLRSDGATGGYAATGTINLNANNAGETLFDITYNGTAKTYKVDLTRGTDSYTTTYSNIDLRSILNNGATPAYVGFTGATGGASAQQNIREFEFTWDGSVNPPLTTYTNAVNVAAGATTAISPILNSTAPNVTNFTMGVLTFQGTSSSTLNVLPVPPSNGTLLSNAAYSLTFGATTLAGSAAQPANSTISVSNNGTGLGTVTLGAVSGAGGSLVKTGAGTLVLAGGGTYAGTTTVQQGVLQVNSTLAAGGAMTVQSGATLGGTGTINRDVVVQTGGTLQGGLGATAANQTLTVGATNATTFNNNSTLRTVVSGAGGASNTAGASLLAAGQFGVATGGVMNILLVSETGANALVSDGSVTYTRRLATYTSLNNITAGNYGNFGGNSPGPFNVAGQNFSPGNWTLNVTGGNIDLVFTPVPEPTTILGIAAAGMGVVGLVRRLRRRQSEATLAA